MALPLPRARVTLPSRDCAAADADSWSQPYHQTRAPFQPAPGCCMTVANHWRQQRVAWSSIRLRAARASAPPGCTGGIPRIPSPLSAHDGRSCTPRLAILKKWWLQRVEGEEAKICVVGEILTPQMILQMSEGESSSKGGMACKVFRSRAIVKCLAYNTIESEDGYTILIHGGFNISKTRENGFSEKVCKSFVCDFRVGWQSLINLKMVPDDEHARSSLETPSPSVGDNFNICGRPQINQKLPCVQFASTVCIYTLQKGFLAAGVVIEEKMESHDSCRTGEDFTYIKSCKVHLSESQEIVVENKVQSIKSKIPILVLLMTKYNVSRGRNHSIWMEICLKFATRYLPRKVKYVLLMYEEKTWPTRILVYEKRCFLGHGWPNFVCQNGLQDGDICLFELNEKNGKIVAMRVHIITKQQF